MKQKIENNVPFNEFTEIIIDKSTYSSIKWIDESEIFYNNILYDIISIVIDKNNIIYITCIYDKEENSLIAQLNEQISNNEKNQQNNEEVFSLLFSKDYLKEKALTFGNNYHIVFCFTDIQSIYISFVSEKPSPPPKFC